MREVLLLTGSIPPDVCGVGDYTQSLALALQNAGIKAQVFVHHRWDVRGTLAASRQLLAAKNALVHIQYPTEGYGYSLGPQFCALARRSIVTLHEFSLAHPLRKISMLPFTLRSPILVMTSEFERKALIQKMPWAVSRTRVIPIGSNIPPAAQRNMDGQNRIVYFGLIMPRKGLEDFIEFARLVRGRNLDWDLVVMGRVLTRHAVYTESLMGLFRQYRVRCVFDPTMTEISELLSRASLGYFPFPDGASERRGSLKAALAAGLPCITTRTQRTPLELEQGAVFAATASEAFDSAMRLVNARSEVERLSQGALRYSQSFSWGKIAQAHVRLYEEVISPMRAR